MTSKSPCDLCTQVDKLRDASRDGLDPCDISFADLSRFSQGCQGPCKLIYAGIIQATTAEAQQRTRYLQIEGGRRFGSQLRVHGADAEWEDTFRIEFFTDAEITSPPWDLCLQSDPLPEHSGDERCLGQLRQWFQACLDGHSACSVSGPRTDQLIRVLKLEADTVRLVESFAVDQPFAALSHCWGDGKHIVTTKQTLDSHKAGIDMDRLPKTFRDAVEVCKYLRIQFLWIDSLCIIQDDALDWRREASKMSTIYQRAEIVICASAARNSSQGLFSSRQQPVKLAGPSETPSNTPGSLFVRRAIEHDFYISVAVGDDEREPLTTRAWCLQEWLLARRVVHFSSRELVWDCRQEVRCECKRLDILHPSSLQDTPSGGQGVLRGRVSEILARQSSEGMTQRNLMELWEEAVTEYTSRDLTKYSDRLIAVLGLAVGVLPHLQSDSHGFGIFEDRQWLPFQLLWSRRDPTKPGVRPDQPVAPSWSWGSISEPIEWSTILPDSNISVRDCDVIDHAEISVGDGEREVSDGAPGWQIRIRTKLLEGMIPAESNIEFGQCIVSVSVPSDGEEKDAFFTLDVDISSAIAVNDYPIRVARIAVFGKANETAEDLEDTPDTLVCGSLVLAPSADDPAQYTRIGVVHGDIEASWFDGAEDCTIEIL